MLKSKAVDILKPKAPKWDWRLIDLFLVVFTILFAVALLAHAYIGVSTRYMADDYCTAAVVHTDGLLGLQKTLYLGWSGRFSFNIAIGVLALLGHQIVPFLPAVALGLMLVVLTWTISRFGSDFNWRRSLFTSVLLAELIIFVTLSDNRGGVYEALYWQTGMLTYWMPLILMVAYVGFVKHMDGSTSRVRPGALHLLLCAALTFIAGGLNETYAVFQVCGLLVAIGWNFMFSEQNYPGTYFYRSLGLLIPALMAKYMIPRAGVTAARDLVPGRKTQWLTILILPLVCFAVVMSCFVPAMYVMSKQPPPRTLVIPQFILISLLVAWSYYTGHLLRYRYFERSRRRFPLIAAVSVVLVSALALAPIQAARRTFSKAARVRALALIWDKQDREIRNAKDRGEKDLTVPVAYNIGGTDLMTADPQWYVNQCVARYYGVNTVTATPSLEGLRIISNVPEE